MSDLLKIKDILKSDITLDNIENDIEITKSILDNIGSQDFNYEDVIEKAGFGKKDITKLRAVKKIVTRDGKTFLTTVYVKDGIEVEHPKKKEKESDSKGHFESKYTIHDVKEGDEISILPKYKKTGIETIGTIKGLYHRKSSDEVTLELQILGTDKLSYFKVKDSEIKKLVSDDKEVLKERKEEASLSIKEMYDKGVSLGGSSDARLYGDKVIKKPRTDLPGKDGELQLAVERAVDFFYTKIDKELITGSIRAKKSEFKEGFLVSDFIEDAVTLNKTRESDAILITNRLKKSFVFDALLANYDVIGADKDNILFKTSTAGVYKVDTGGSLFFRARGKRKPYTDDVSEIDTLRDASINPVTSKIYGSISDDEIAKQVARIVNNEKYITDVFDVAILSIPEDLLSIEEKGKLLKTFKNRIENLKERFLEKPKEKVEESKEDKGEYESVVTKKFFEKFDKYEVDPSINPHLKSTIKERIIEFEKKNEDKYIRYAKKHSMSVEEYKQTLQNLLEKLVNKDTKIFRATDYNCLENIINDGRFKSQFEIRKSHGCLDPYSRSVTELGFFGFNKDAEEHHKKGNEELRPIYGYPSNDVNGAHNNDGKTPPSNYVSSYGDMTIEIKDTKRSHTTFTLNDSLGDQDQYVANFLDLPHFTSFKMSSSYDGDPLDTLMKRNGINKLESRFGSPFNYSYMELQIHGGLKTSDIKAVHVNFNKSNKEKMDRQIKRAVQLISKNEDVKLEIFD